MENRLETKFIETIKSVKLGSIQTAIDMPTSFLIGQDRQLSAFYIPFDFINAKAKVVLVGITPGLTQWKNAVAEMQRQLSAGSSIETAFKETKKIGAFSGAMRSNLIVLLNAIGVQNWLNIGDCESLFDENSDLIHTCSILRHPVFLNGENYNGNPSMIKTPFLKNQVSEYFSGEAMQLKDAIYIPLGPVVSDGINLLVGEGILSAQQILHGLPHPSGANAERIAYFIGKKNRANLSIKTNPAKLDEVRSRLKEQIQSLPKAFPA